MPIITLTSDWGQRDYFLAAVKGKILSLLPSANIIDISHGISPFNLKQASFIVRNSFPHFPKGTVHMLIRIDGEVRKDTPSCRSIRRAVFYRGR
jgi:S-adenosyl-L-methionine hydrolase (adenosine-forming)